MKTNEPKYPLMENQVTDLHAASGRNVNEINLEAALSGELSPADLQINAETLRAQAQIAAQAGFAQLAENLSRSAELTAVPNEELLRMYSVVRPGRSTYAELQTLAETLEKTYNAPLNAQLVREAAAVYQQRNLLKRTF
ncbi:MAG: diol dehydratase small subunit [Caldilineaceae bacterium]